MLIFKLMLDSGQRISKFNTVFAKFLANNIFFSVYDSQQKEC